MNSFIITTHVPILSSVKDCSTMLVITCKKHEHEPEILHVVYENKRSKHWLEMGIFTIGSDDDSTKPSNSKREIRRVAKRVLEMGIFARVF